jgi:2-methylisoborneol synthase
VSSEAVSLLSEALPVPPETSAPHPGSVAAGAVRFTPPSPAPPTEPSGGPSVPSGGLSVPSGLGSLLAEARAPAVSPPVSEGDLPQAVSGCDVRASTERAAERGAGAWWRCSADVPSTTSPGYSERQWGDGTHSPLYCPDTVRINEPLGEEVNEALVAWAEQTGIHAGRIDKFRETGFGRLAMLTHPDTDDPDRLLVAAQMNAAWWACDDYYADESELGATPVELPPRLALCMSAMDAPPPAGPYTSRLEEAIQSEPVLRALSSATAHLARHSTPSQRMRVCMTSFQMWVSWTAYAAWRFTGEPPAVWRYLAARQHDSFYTSMTLCDVVGGYQLPANLFYEQRFHHALMQAGTASVIVNDLHSAAKEAADDQSDNLVLLVAAERKCSLDDAIEKCVALHNDFVRGFEKAQRELALVPSTELQRFLRGAQSWMGGGLEWHSTSSRYQ